MTTCKVDYNIIDYSVSNGSGNIIITYNNDSSTTKEYFYSNLKVSNVRNYSDPYLDYVEVTFNLNKINDLDTTEYNFYLNSQIIDVDPSNWTGKIQTTFKVPNLQYDSFATFIRPESDNIDNYTIANFKNNELKNGKLNLYTIDNPIDSDLEITSENIVDFTKYNLLEKIIEETDSNGNVISVSSLLTSSNTEKDDLKFLSSIICQSYIAALTCNVVDSCSIVNAIAVGIAGIFY